MGPGRLYPTTAAGCAIAAGFFVVALAVYVFIEMVSGSEILAVSSLVVLSLGAMHIFRVLDRRAPREPSRFRCLAGKALVTAEALLIVTFLVAFSMPTERGSQEYGGRCGWYRGCTSGVLGLGRHCELYAGVLFKPFAPQSACSDDWHRVFWYKHTLMSIIDGGPGRGPGWAISQLERFYAAEDEERRATGKYATSGRFIHLLNDVSPYVRQDCAGEVNAFGDDAYRVVVAANLDDDTDLDCWMLTSDGALRHLSHDR